MTRLSFATDRVAPARSEPIETALFMGVRGDPALESTQLRWQVRLSAEESVQLEDGGLLHQYGGALFITTKEPRPEPTEGESPDPIGWLRWIAAAGRRSFQIQLSISRIGFDRVCGQAGRARFPTAILTFQDQGVIEPQAEEDGVGTLWKNTQSKVALIAEYTLRYDLSPMSDLTAA